MATKKRKPAARPARAGKGAPAERTGAVAAINRSQAVVELALDGAVLAANDNFLNALGYSLAEIKAQNHRLFVDPVDSQGGDYQQFWATLARGEAVAGQYRRIAKGGREIWFQASYNPILDKKGKPSRVIAFATDITDTKRRLADYEGQLNAVSKAQAVVEFSLDGTVLTANENFLKTLGYSLEEIHGKHHSLFVDPAETRTVEYRQFWDKLGSGEYDAGQYRRIAKGGKEVWIQATYNPIMDMNGRPFKVVKYATDITAQRREAEMNAAIKGALDNLTSNVMVADTDLHINYLNTTVKGMFGDAQADIRRELPQFDVNLLIGANVDALYKDPAQQRSLLAGLNETTTSQFVLGGRTLRVIANPMFDQSGKRLGTVFEWADRTVELAVEREIQEIVAAANEGDLKARIPLEGKNGFHETLARGINQLADNMSEIVGCVKVTAAEVARSADEISQGNADLSQRTEEQASSLEETASSMEEMTSTVKQNADNAGQANQLAVAARDQAERGGGVVAKAVKAMAEINEASKKIADIIGVIDEIAFQTNLLALNAAVEAARAGEQGRGFAVVASEVRNLAGRSATAAREIKDLIHDSSKKVDEGSALVAQSGHTLEQLVSAVKKVSDIIAEIAAASQEQSAGIEQVNKAVMQLDSMTQQNSALVEEASAASESMAGQARGLAEMMDKYQVSQEGVASAASREAPAATTAPERRGAARPWAKAPTARTPVSAAAATGTDNDWQQF